MSLSRAGSRKLASGLPGGFSTRLITSLDLPMSPDAAVLWLRSEIFVLEEKE